MADLEQFGGGDGSGKEAMSEAAMEAIREQMRQAGKQLKALQKGESKKKKKEDKLAKLITQFLQKKSKRSDLAITAATLLSLNIPPAFVLSMLLLGDSASQAELSMTTAEDDKGLDAAHQPDIEGMISLSGNDLSYMMTDDEAQTAQLHAALVPWVQTMYIQAKNDPLRMLKNAKTETEEIQPSIIECMMMAMRYFLEDRGLILPPENLQMLSQIILMKIFTELAQNFDKLQELREQEFQGLPGDTSTSTDPV